MAYSMDPGQQAAYEAAQLADPTGGQNGGMGAGGGGGGGGLMRFLVAAAQLFNCNRRSR